MHSDTPHSDTPHPDHPPVPDPTAELPPEPADGPDDSRPNRATRRGKRGDAASASHGHGVAPHSRGVQGRRVNPVRRPG